MYLFISNGQHISKFKDFGSDYIFGKNLNSIRKKVISYSDNYYYKGDVPGTLVFRKKYGAVVEKYCGDVIGWIVKI